ncbi:bifunctional nuclease 1-like [Dorcoceras hygrometricum]|uniref:Bifunctional nuclease 1-like n=1 Tax=Dorcoceras hygrometricum TaxID=472368 RepID=A0A2Z7DE66_9LAMI|nr:bifunctional nuclease 1-like [Dorcoceras hygrometricum]
MRGRATIPHSHLPAGIVSPDADILAKSIFVKAGSFDAVTHESFLLMAAITGGVKINWGRLLFNIFKEMVTVGSRQAKGYAIQICVLLKDVPALELGDSKAFPSPRILTEKTVHRYVVINEKVTVEEVANKPRKKRTKVGKADKGSVLITVAQEAVPLTIFEPTPAAPAEQPPVLKRKSKKRRLQLHKDSDDEIVKERGAVEEAESEPTVENEPVVKSTAEEVRTMSADDVDLIIEQVIDETAQNETDEEEQNVDGIDVEGMTVSGTDVGEQTVPRDEETDQWFNLFYEEFIAQEADKPVVTASDTDEEMEIVDFGTGVGEQQLQIFDENESSVDASAAYIVTEPEAKTVKAQGMDIPDVVPAAADKDIVIQLHLFLLEELKILMQAHGLTWYRTCCSKILEGRQRDRGAVITRSNPNIHSSCWIRTMILVNGSWVIEPCADYWKPLPGPVICNEVLPQLSYVDTLPPPFASSVFEEQSVQMFLDQRHFSSSTSDDSSIRFDENDTAATSTSLPAIATDFIESFARLHASIDQVQFEQIRRRNDADKLKEILLLHIRDLEKQVNARFDEHDKAYRALLTNIRKDMHDHTTALSLDVVKSQQRICTQVAAASFDTVDVRKEVKELM